MMNVKLTSLHSGREVLLNWDNVNFIMSVKNYSGQEYTEVCFNSKSLEVRETFDEVRQQIRENNS